MRSMDVLEKADRIAGVFRGEPSVVAAYLFGSVAADRAWALSDVDFAVILREPSPRGLDLFVVLERLAVALSDLLGVSETRVDVTALNGQGPVFQHSVLRTGKRIYESDRRARVLFEWKAIMRFLDFKPTLDIYDRTRGWKGRTG